MDKFANKRVPGKLKSFFIKDIIAGDDVHDDGRGSLKIDEIGMRLFIFIIAT